MVPETYRPFMQLGMFLTAPVLSRPHKVSMKPWSEEAGRLREHVSKVLVSGWKR